MKKGKAYTLDFRRKRKGKTDYRTRLNLLVSRNFRVVLRRMLNNFSVQIVDFSEKGDRVLVSAYTRELIKYGWKGHRGNVSSSYLVGLLCGLKAKKKNINSGVADFGCFRIIRGSSFFAALKGLIDSGFNISVSEKYLPSEDRIKGLHIQNYAEKIKGSPSYQKQFSNYLKSGLKPDEFIKHFEEVKNKIVKDGSK
ncbi:50S ribosomal protein L18 [Candidatus Woesearchaeota archaeon]|nr:50S ribosomal protein L18 [Candidatus Woesearchaeota archaeon]